MIVGIQIISGLVSASILFLLAAGLSLIFGVCRVLNLAHGALYMLGLYLSVSVTRWAGGGNAGFLAALVIVPAILAALGALIEVTLFRRLYDRDVLAQILPTIAVTFLIQDLVRFGWGFDAKSVSVPPMLTGPIRVMGVFFPVYYGFIVLVSVAVAVLLWAAINRTDWGLLIRATARDRTMASLLAVDAGRIFTSVFAIAMALAGLAGVLFAPIGGATPGAGIDSTTDAFAVVVTGGLGSVWGGASAAVLVGLVKSIGLVYLPQFSVTFVFLIMALVLVFRPAGLFGKRQ